MPNKIFIDTNIIIDFLDRNRKNNEDAVTLFEELENGNCIGFVTECVLNTTVYLLRKHYSVNQIKPIFQHFLSFIQLIPVTNATYNTALNFNSTDIEDAVLYTASIEAKLNYFITSNNKDYKKMEIASLPVLSLNEFVATYI